ncbi:ATP-binding cassette domain-containing protein [Bacillus velezensis]|uniref:ABC transporter ATP-binding protein n=1 Tax=Bacillus TaxID=1386 RepID=UPI0006974883|nr:MULTISPECIES: ATP-binding cassette domain-containing protein [Bacillus amyloliquefaciens group]MEC2216130.1 ATP-binding cassette domain-containing protein [Bacillus velezensis]NMV98627.1 ATP-binding cassette domain-containing protein [Bacillus velezensis]QVL92419.1 ATP-binding cassette domain-containing protein [Bacillus velezensis]TNU64834.1 ATP-binding cassette domain-containing protein [Bacillus velezensis]UJA37009.1 ATP-binding cassette domain-containing protein [Bacillus velezensis]
MGKADPALISKGINVSIKKKEILHDINLTLEKGKIYGLLGPNGAGKTTLLKVLLGIFPPTSGEVIFEENDLYENPNNDVIQSIGSIIEFPGFYENLNLFENIKLHLNYLKKSASDEEINEILGKVGLFEHKDKLFSQTSLGMKQRLGIARAVAHAPALLLLDEPTNGLDPYGIKEVREMLIQEVMKNGTTVVISSHLLSEINLMADELLIMNKGQIIFESAFMKNTQHLYLYKIPAEAGINWADIEKFADHVISKNKQQFEFISIIHPSEMKEKLNSWGFNKASIDGFKLSLEDLYLKLLAKEKGHESVSA